MLFSKSVAKVRIILRTANFLSAFIEDGHHFFGVFEIKHKEWHGETGECIKKQFGGA